MKSLGKILIVVVFFFGTGIFCTYAEEMKTAETVQAATATTPEAPSVPQKAIEKTRLDQLQAEFNFQRNANVRYLACAKRADEEGYSKAARIFRAAARSEQVHFERLARTIEMFGGVPQAKVETPVIKKSTLENLKDSRDGEVFESMIMYPRYQVNEEKANIKAEEVAFTNARKADAAQALFFAFNFRKGVSATDEQTDIHVCPDCGNVIFLTGVKICPICGTSREKFIKVS
jgi:rubrerythrin